MSYIGRSSKLVRKAQDKVSFLATAGQTVKTGLSYTPTSVEVYVNGILLTDTTDFTATNGNSVTFTVALALNDEVTVISLKTFSVADHYTKTEDDARFLGKAGGTMTGNLVLSAANSQVGIGTDNMQIFNSVGGSSGLVVTGVSSSTAILGNTLSNITIANGDGTANNTAALHFAREDTDGNPNYAGASIVSQFKETQVTGQYPKADLAFLTSTSANSAPSEKMRIDSSGIVTIPNQPSFKVHQNNTTLSSAGLATVSFSDSETYAFDNGNNFSSNIFTAPVAGKYFFAASLRVDGLNDYFRMVITQNDRNDYSSDIHAIYNPNSSVNFHSFAASGILNLAANDTVRVNISSTNDSSWISQGEGTFSGYLLG